MISCEIDATITQLHVRYHNSTYFVILINELQFNFNDTLLALFGCEYAFSLYILRSLKLMFRHTYLMLLWKASIKRMYI